MTGATFLWQRLKAPRVVKSIKLGNDLLVFSTFPKFLNDFPSLEHLSIQSCDESGMKIYSIPSGVKNLELSGRKNPRADLLFGKWHNFEAQ